MPVSNASSDITVRIQSLLDQREEHTKAIAAIEETLAKVGAALGTPAKPPKPAAPIPKAVAPAKPAAPKPAPPKPAAPAKGTRTRRQFAISGEQSILQFVKSKSSPKGSEIETHWKSEGRKGRAINLISKLAKEKKLKRIPLKGERGSRYSVA
jgi:hypothetical protein